MRGAADFPLDSRERPRQDEVRGRGNLLGPAGGIDPRRQEQFPPLRRSSREERDGGVAQRLPAMREGGADDRTQRAKPAPRDDRPRSGATSPRNRRRGRDGSRCAARRIPCAPPRGRRGRPTGSRTPSLPDRRTGDPPPPAAASGPRGGNDPAVRSAAGRWGRRWSTGGSRAPFRPPGNRLRHSGAGTLRKSASTISTEPPASRSRRCAARPRSTSTATTGAPASARHDVSAPSPGPISRYGGGKERARATILPATFRSARKFCPSDLRGDRPRAARVRRGRLSG